MIGKITDEHSVRSIMCRGIIPAIYAALDKKDETVDQRICEVGNLINAYEQFFLTGRSIDVPQRCEKEGE